MNRRALPAIVLVALVAIGSIAYVFNRARPTADVIATCDLNTKPTVEQELRGISSIQLTVGNQILSIGDKLTLSTNLPSGLIYLLLGPDEFGPEEDLIHYSGKIDDGLATVSATINDGSPPDSRFSTQANTTDPVFYWPNIWQTIAPEQLAPGNYSMTFTITGGTPGWHPISFLGSNSIKEPPTVGFLSTDYFCIQPATSTVETAPKTDTTTPAPIIRPNTTDPITETPTATTPTTTTPIDTTPTANSSSTNTIVDTTAGTATPTTSSPKPTDTVTGSSSTTQDATSTSSSTSSTQSTTPVASTSTSTTSTQEVATVAATTIPSTTNTTTTNTEAKTPAPTQSTLQIASSALASTNTAPTAPASSSSTSATTTSATPTSTSASTTSTSTTTTTEPTVKAGAPVVVKLKGTTPKKPVTISVNGKAVATVTPSKENVDVPVTIPISTPDGKTTVTAHSDNWNADLNFPIKVASAKAGMSTERRNSLIAIIIFIALLSIGILYVVFGGHKKTEDPQTPVKPQIPPTEPPTPPTSTTPTPSAQH
jgi:hypothetical protein